MKETKFTITVDETGESMTRTLIPSIMRVFNTRWTSDKQGKNKITEAKLEETVYFHMDVEGFKTGSDLHLKLFEYDDFLGIDWANKDDYKFPNTEIVIDAKVEEKNGVRCVSVELTLDNSWQQVIKDDQRGDLSNYIELYWKAFFVLPSGRLIGGIVPEKTEDMLKVSFSDKTLYFNFPDTRYNFPEMFTDDGNPLLIVNYAKDKIKSEVKGKLKKIGKTGANKIANKVNTSINKTTQNIALAKIEKGFLVDSRGKIHTNKRKLYDRSIFIDGKLTNVKMGKNFGNKHITTKRIDQFNFFTKNGKKVEFLNALKVSENSINLVFNNVTDVLNVIDFATNDLDTSQPISVPIPNPVFSIAFELLGQIALQQHKEDEEFIQQVIKQELEEAKLQGIAAIEKFVEIYEFSEGYRLESIAPQTLNKLLNSEFKTLERLRDFNINKTPKNIKLLYREIENPNRGEKVYFIETIFLNY